MVGDVTVRLEAGVGEYELLVAAAARALATTSAAGHAPGGRLADAVDRIDGLTAALSELAGSHAGRLG